MTQQAPLRWRRHRLSTIPAEQVPDLLRGLAPARSLTSSLRSAAAEGTAAAGAAIEVAEVESVTIDLPELPDSPVEKAATLLRVARADRARPDGAVPVRRQPMQTAGKFSTGTGTLGDAWL